jgi:hypothetical protein
MPSTIYRRRIISKCARASSRRSTSCARRLKKLSIGFNNLRVSLITEADTGVLRLPSEERETAIDSFFNRLKRSAAFQAYTDQRCADTHAINDLSKENYLEMRSGASEYR